MGLHYRMVTAVTYGSAYMNLEPQLRKWYNGNGEMIDVLKIDDLGGWERNTHTKPVALWTAIRNGHNAIATDADTLIGPNIVLPDGDWDIGLARQFVPWHKNKYEACVVVARPTPATFRWLAGWLARCMCNPRDKDHPHMVEETEVGQICYGLKVLETNEILRGKVDFNALMPGRGRFQYV